MANRDGVILQLYSRARAPNRDYYGLTISSEDVVLNVWNITHGPHVFPRKQTCALVDLQIAKPFVIEIERLFGLHVVDYCLALGRGDARIECLPTKLFLKILRGLAGNDILKLGQTSKIFFELCNRNDVWGIIFAKRNKCKPSRDEVKAAEHKGWKLVLRNKLVWSDSVNRNKALKTAARTKADVSKQKPKGADLLAVIKKTEVHKNPAIKVSISKEAIKVPEHKLECLNHLVSLKRDGKTSVAPPKRDLKQKSVTNKNLNECTAVPIEGTKERSITPTPKLPPKGILKKAEPSGTLSTTSKLLNFSDKLESISEKKNLMTNINYSPMSRADFASSSDVNLNNRTIRSSLDSVLNGLFSKEDKSPVLNAKDRRLARILGKLDSDLEQNPYKHVPTLLQNFTSNLAPKELRTAPKNQYPTTQTMMNKLVPQAPTKPKIVEFLSQPKAAGDTMTSKFENYLSSFKNHESPLNSPITRSKTELMPKISELQRSINHIRSNFYNSDNLKMTFGAKMNNTKVVNKNSASQQLNNKLNNILPTSTSALEVKRNVLKTSSKSATPKTVAAKVKNTNSTANINQAVKPKSASKVAKSTSYLNTKKS